MLHNYSAHLNYHYTPELHTSVCINEVLMHGRTTFVCLLHEAAEQCAHVLQTRQLSVVFDQTVYGES